MNNYEQRRAKRFYERSFHISSKYLQRITQLSNVPDALSPFLKVMESIFTNFEGVRSRMPTIGTFCTTLPHELIYALGAMPVKLCSGHLAAFQIAEDFAPRDACPLVKSVMGQAKMQTQIYNNCSMMVVPVTCDCKRKLAQCLPGELNVLPLHLPAKRRDDEDMEDFTRELYAMADEISAVTGVALTHKNLAQACEQSMRTHFELSRFIKLRRRHPLIIKGTHALLAMNCSSYMHTEAWRKCLKNLNDELTENADGNVMAGRQNLPRLLLTGSPVAFPNYKIPLLIEESGGAIVADETCMGERGLYDPPVVVDNTVDGMFRAFANRSVRACTCPSFSDNERRIYRLKQMVKDYSVQGIVYHVLKGCLVYDFEVASVERELGVPVLRLETDYSEEDIEQLRTRIEAFTELIKFGGAGK